MIEQKLTLSQDKWEATATLCQVEAPLELLCNTAHEWLHDKEMTVANHYTISKRKHSYLLGRYCAKQCLQSQLHIPSRNNISIENGIFGQPILYGPGTDKWNVSLAHSNMLGVALVYPKEHPMGIDIETIDPKRHDLLMKFCTSEEMSLLSKFPKPHDISLALTWVWTAKEALGKTLLTGLTVPFEMYEIQDIKFTDHIITAQYKHFRQYKVTSYLWKNSVISIALPSKTVIHFSR